MIDMRVQFYVPIIPNPPAAKLRHDIIEAAGGLTEWPARGYWTSPTHPEVVIESGHVYEFFIADDYDNRLWLEQLAREYKSSAQQEAVLYVINASETNWIED